MICASRRTIERPRPVPFALHERLEQPPELFGAQTNRYEENARCAPVCLKATLFVVQSTMTMLLRLGGRNKIGAALDPGESTAPISSPSPTVPGGRGHLFFRKIGAALGFG